MVILSKGRSTSFLQSLKRIDDYAIMHSPYQHLKYIFNTNIDLLLHF